MVSRRFRAKDFYRFLRSVESFSDGQASVLSWDCENINEIKIQLRPNDGPYHGGKFAFRICLTDDFPNSAPQVTCETAMYHPNIDPYADDCNVCVNLLDEWQPTFGLEDCVQALLFLIHNPNQEDPLSPMFSGDDDDDFSDNVKKSLLGCTLEGFTFPRNWYKADIDTNLGPDKDVVVLERKDSDEECDDGAALAGNPKKDDQGFHVTATDTESKKDNTTEMIPFGDEVDVKDKEVHVHASAYNDNCAVACENSGKDLGEDDDVLVDSNVDDKDALVCTSGDCACAPLSNLDEAQKIEVEKAKEVADTEGTPKEDTLIEETVLGNPTNCDGVREESLSMTEILEKVKEILVSTEDKEEELVAFQEELMRNSGDIHQDESEEETSEEEIEEEEVPEITGEGELSENGATACHSNQNDTTSGAHLDYSHLTVNNATNETNDRGFDLSNMIYERQSSKMDRVESKCDSCDILEENGRCTTVMCRTEPESHHFFRYCSFVAPDYDLLLNMIGMACMFVLREFIDKGTGQ